MKHIKFDGNSFGSAIFTARKILGVGVRGLKDYTGASAATISRLENGGTPDIITYVAICQWLKKPLNTFIKIKK